MKPVGLIAGMAALLAAASVLAGSADSPFDKRLAADKQPLHVLNRLAFGPRPGDVAEVRRRGVKAWIRMQLDPARLPEDPALAARLETLPSLRLPTWQLMETFQAPQMMMTSVMIDTQPLPGELMVRLISGNASLDERRAALKSLPPDVRSKAFGMLPPQVVDGLPEYQQEAAQARQMRQEEQRREREEQQRRLRPPLSELFTPDELVTLRRGTDEQKTELLAALEPDRRATVFRSMGPQGAAMLPPAYRREALLVANPRQGVVAEMVEAKLQRAVFSNRQLEEVLTDFWFNHFNVSAGKQQLPMLLPSYERDAIRPHVLGHFRDMLLATARHPAMLLYLDNYQSRAPNPQQLAASLAGSNIRVQGINENYGRELMELHTLGVDGGYTQDDVISVARVFTGWTIHDPGRVGEFQFNPQYHDRGEKTVLGQDFVRGGGEEEGVRVIDMLASHPSTARFISRKLAQRFVADDPPQKLVDRMAATFTRTGGDLRAVMETLLLSDEFLSEGAWRSKIKSPLEMVASSLRALDAQVEDTTAIAENIARLGQPLYQKAEPTGYPNTSEMWANSVGLLGRMNFAAALLDGQVAGVKATPDAVITGDVRRSMQALTGVAASREVVAALEKGAGDGPPSPALIATLLIGSPDFQRK